MQISPKPIKITLTLAFLIATFTGRATPIVGPWKPQFKGVDYSVSTNASSGGDFSNLQVVHAFRVNLTDPDIRLFTTPRNPNYVEGDRETVGRTTSDFLSTYHLQAAINANFFAPGDYYPPAGTPMDVYGLAISEGVVVSPQNGSDHAAAILFDINNQATFIPTNWPPASVNGIYTAVSGDYPLVVAGRNVVNRSTACDVQPRTVFGISEDRHFLYLLGIDGRQPGYSEGATDYESAAWLLLLGAYDGINVDGGGSTLLVIEDSTGVPIRLSKSSAVAGSSSGRERTVGSHLGVSAKPLPGFINDVVAQADDTTASITWTTLEPATSEVEYGATTEFGNSTGVQPDLVTNHLVQLTGLTPSTGYYFRVISATTQQYLSANYFFVTTNYVTTNRVFEITNSWKYTTTNLTGVNWSGTNYTDSAWSGPGQGLLWVDTRATPNPNVQPKSTQMAVDPNNSSFPYITYYFRTRFVMTNIVQGGALAFSGYIDDGAVFYLNGVEIYRLRVPANQVATTLATNFPCGGDADCLDSFTIPMASLTNLAIGENVLAAEVHNYNLQSRDITFGLSVDRIEPIVRTARIEVSYSGNTITLSWDVSGYVLQSADSPEGSWSDVQGNAASPFVVEPSESNHYYRLRK